LLADVECQLGDSEVNGGKERGLHGQMKKMKDKGRGMNGKRSKVEGFLSSFTIHPSSFALLPSPDFEVLQA